MRALWFALALAALAAPAAAQMDPRPATSRAERQIMENSRALELQQQQRSFTQQQMFPPPGRGCPTGAVSC
jgi:hypothetical protein